MGVMKRVCLFTGASGLLGTAFLERYAHCYEVVAVHHTSPIQFATQDQAFVDPLLPETELPANGHAVHAVCADLSQAAEIDRVLEVALRQFGRVDLLISAAAHRQWSSLLDPAALRQAERTIAINVLAPMRLAIGLTLRFWGEDPEGNVEANRNIINISSTAGSYVYPDQGQALYATSKAALNHLTYHLASELWDVGVRVNAVAPDTFPARVSIDEILDAVLEFDRSAATGEVRLLAREPA
jgi:NAD(P)-dependent dehydrogenase (short-subunit alcohol dehydrogenase family)